MAITYITVGALAIVWTGIWYFYLNSYPPQTPAPYYWCTGILLSGVALMIIGLAIGQIGRSARHAEMPPPEATPPPQPEPNAAPRAVMIVPANTTPAGQTSVPVAQQVGVAGNGVIPNTARPMQTTPPAPQQG
jgi:hypothetical protein